MLDLPTEVRSIFIRRLFAFARPDAPFSSLRRCGECRVNAAFKFHGHQHLFRRSLASRSRHSPTEYHGNDDGRLDERDNTGALARATAAIGRSSDTIEIISIDPATHQQQGKGRPLPGTIPRPSLERPQRTKTSRLRANELTRRPCLNAIQSRGFNTLSVSRAIWRSYSPTHSRCPESSLCSKPPRYVHAEVRRNFAALAEPESPSGPLACKERQVRDLEFIKANMELPTEDQYPSAPRGIHSSALASTFIHNIASQQKVPIHIDATYTQVDVRVCECVVKLSIPSVCEETGIGEHARKKEARQAAFLHILSKLHTSGALTRLLSKPKVTSDAPENPSTKSATDHPATQDEVAVRDVYNYAAAYGSLPHLIYRPIDPQSPLAAAAEAERKPCPKVEVSIQWSEGGINVKGVGESIDDAETAACLAFKAQTRLQLDAQRADASLPQPYCAILKVDTASRFIDYCKTQGKTLRHEVAHHLIEIADGSRDAAVLVIDGYPKGPPVVMPLKQQAYEVLGLQVAIVLSVEQPALFEKFSNLWKDPDSREGRELRAELRPSHMIEFEIDRGALQAMRSGLIEARQAGLPDRVESLSAEPVRVTDRSPSQGKSPSSGELQVFREKLLVDHERYQTNPRLRELRSAKVQLPMNRFRHKVLNIVSKNLFSVIIGATGSGKSTQVPQILFEDWIARGSTATCNIICTQPRRIAATSVAQRVAIERDEPLRKTIGYHVRGDAKYPQKPCGITYCTTGILLRRLLHSPDEVFEATTHILIDEVHERDIDIDFLMTILKQLILNRQARGKKVPHVVLMSATLDADLFAQYFAYTDPSGTSRSCPSLSVPGRLFPVEEKYVDTVLHEIRERHGLQIDAIIDMHPPSRGYFNDEIAFQKLQKKRKSQDSADEPVPSDLAREKLDDIMPISLFGLIIADICATTSEGAILVFLPGLAEILEVRNFLWQVSPLQIDFTDPAKFSIHLLHSTVPKEDQVKVFETLAPGCRKIILSTNIAETSVTVTDVKYVVDSGKLREMRYDQVRRVGKLANVWESKSNAKQRAGRAGRVQAGSYYALFTRERADSMRAVGLPEILRSDLQDICLAIKAHGIREPVANFLAQAIEPPAPASVEVAVKNLIALQAYTSDQQLTTLGRVLSHLPVHPTLGKMIILGLVFKCLDAMIILAAAAGERSLFIQPLGDRTAVNEVRSSRSGEVQSDHFACLAAFDELRVVQQHGGRDAAAARARDNYLHMGAFQAIDSSARQIQLSLQESGLIPPAQPPHSSQVPRYCPPEYDVHGENRELLQSMLLAGHHPNLAVKLSDKGVIYRTPNEHAMISRSSLNYEKTKKHPASSIFTYGTLHESSNSNGITSMHETTPVVPLMALLFGGSIQLEKNGKLVIDGWLPMSMQGPYAEHYLKLTLEFRKALDRVLNEIFSSLSPDDKTKPDGLERKPLHDKFIARVVEVLDWESGRIQLDTLPSALRNP